MGTGAAMVKHILAEVDEATVPIIDDRPQCWRCHRTLANFLARPWSLTCKRCKAPNSSL